MIQQGASVGFRSRLAARLPHLDLLLDARACYLPPGMTRGVEAVAGWGRKSMSRSAQALAERRGLPFFTVEDGFLRSLERDDPPLSIVIDDLGIYYDATRASRLEKLIPEPLSDDETARARSVIEAWRGARASKYNHAREHEGDLPARYVLVCDQTYGDASIHYGQAGPESFERMLQAALAEHPDATVLVKTHPDVVTRKRRGYLDPALLARNPRILVSGDGCHPVSLIEHAAAVYTVTSQLGLEALLWGKPVRTFGMPFYAGWGLTADELPAPERRGGSASLEQLAHAALIRYPRYLDPETGERCEMERALAHIGLQRRMRQRFASEICAIGFSRWKKPILRRFLAGSRLHFHADWSAVPARATAAVWGSDLPDAASDERNILRLEDGFLRSVGLGADLTHPVSWVCDDVGIYYNAGQPSRLDRILLETEFDDALVVRARALRSRILASGITKYNLHGRDWQRPDTDRKVILVPGQVEGDASIRYGSQGIKTNLGLLQAVRAANPDAFVVYKTHPDVVAGLRERGESEGRAADFCDQIVTDTAMSDMLGKVDEVHTLTSLAGFEALMRGKPVSCHGQPFYSGWGLTTDLYPVAHRGRSLSLDQLVAAALILYPTYLSRVTGRFTTPERAIEELIAWRETGGGSSPLWRKALRPVLRLAKEIRNRRAALRRRSFPTMRGMTLHGR